MTGTTAGPREPDNADEAEASALRVLRGAGQSSASLQRKLERRGYTADAAEEAVRRCAAAGYIDDTALAVSVAARHRRSGHGRARVAADLRARGVPGDVIAEALDGQTDTEEAAALAVAAQLWHRAGDPETRDQRARMRIAGALQRRGFSSALVVRVMRALG
ncbi:MAG: regulatory protein [Chloroflexota bacterium]|jgi:regulatory protein|nr:regulatory protein [Chloroflexota bacterium]